MTGLLNNITLNYLVPSPIFHFYHEAQYSKNIWRDYGSNWCLELGLIDETQLIPIKTDTESLDQYLSNICAQTIRTLGSSFKELNLGACVQVPKGGVFAGTWNEFLSQERYHFAWCNQQDLIDESFRIKSQEVENIEHIILDLFEKNKAK